MFRELLSICQIFVANIYYIYSYYTDQTHLGLVTCGVITCLVQLLWIVYINRQVRCNVSVKGMVNLALMLLSYVIMTEIIVWNLKNYDNSAIIIVTTQYLYLLIHVIDSVKGKLQRGYFYVLLVLLIYCNIRVTQFERLSINFYFHLAFTLLTCLKIISKASNPGKEKKDKQNKGLANPPQDQVQLRVAELEEQNIIEDKIQINEAKQNPFVPEINPQSERQNLEQLNSNKEVDQSIEFQQRHPNRISGHSGGLQSMFEAKGSLLNLIPECIIILNAQDLQVQFINSATQKLFKIDSPEQFLVKMEELKHIEFLDPNKKEKSPQGPVSFATYTSVTQDLRNSLVYGANNNFIHTSTKYIVRQSINIQQDQIHPLNELEEEKSQKMSVNFFLKLNQDNLLNLTKDVRKLSKITFIAGDLVLRNFFGTNSSFQNILIFQQENLESLLIIGEQNKPKKTRKVELSLYSMSLEGEKTILIEVRDITHRNYIKLLREHSREKSNLISFVSHEFRGPLNNMILLLNVAREQFQNKIDPALIQHLQIVTNNCEYLLGLSNDLLDLALIKAGKFRLNMKPFDLLTLIDECQQLFRIEAYNRKVQLNLEVGLNIPKSICNDPNRIRQILINLLTNAFKFTSKGSIIVSIERVGIQIKIEVQDSGLGIKVEDQPKIMTAFGKLNNGESGSLNEKGVGLGLLISNIIAKSLNEGNIGLLFSSEYHAGTNFWFFVQDQNQDQQFQEQQILEESEGSSEEDCYKINYEDPSQNTRGRNTSIANNLLNNFYGKKPRVSQNFSTVFMGTCQCYQILIVDDVQFNIDMLKMILLRSNPSLKINSSICGYDAVSIVNQQLEYICPLPCKGYQLIFMDIEMPIQDGYETARQIRALYKKYNKNITIIGQSAHQGDLQNKALLQKMDEFLTKPIRRTDIKMLLDKYL